MSEREAFYITTPIYYVNDSPHIGHAYTTIACDALARFKRLDGFDVRFLTGTDEHGQKVEKSARAAGLEPQEFCDRVSRNFRDLFKRMNITNDGFIRTTDEHHMRAVQALWQRLMERGQIYPGNYAGWYSVRDEAFFGESELTEGQGGEKCAPTGAPVEWVEEPSYFFRLSEWGDKLLALYEDHPEFLGPESRRNEVISFVKSGLRDLSVTRTSFKWGIPVPGDDAHIMYVWLDALSNYITYLGAPDRQGADWARFWPVAMHMIGKDILRFHAVYWPAFLLAAGIAPPKRIFAHGWWTNEGEKISKSLGNVIDPYELIDTYGLDQMRYFLLREVPFGKDGDFSRRAMVHRINGDLANDFGNLAQRCLKMIAKNCDGKIPRPGPLTDADKALLATVDGLHGLMATALDRQAFDSALKALWQAIGDANTYFAHQEPWVLRKSDPDRMATVLYTTAEAIRQFAVLAQPFVPEAAARLLDQLAIAPDRHAFATLGEAGRLVPGMTLGVIEGVFPRHIEKDEE